METGRWNGHIFEVSANLMRGFKDLQIKSSIETDTKKSKKQEYIKRKNGRPAEVSFTVILNAMTGCDVRTEAMAFINEAKAGKSSYFYVSGKKLMTCKLMLTDASVKDIKITGETWIRATVQLTMKQASKDGTTTSTTTSKSSKGSKKTSVKKKSTTTTKTTTKQASKKQSASSKSSSKSSGSSSGSSGSSGAGKTTTKTATKTDTKAATKQVVSNAVAAVKKVSDAAKKQSPVTKSSSKTTGGSTAKYAMTR